MLFYGNHEELYLCVMPQYQSDLSSKIESHWEFRVFIVNAGKDNVRIVDKHCKIICADGTSHEIYGLSEQALIIEPGAVLESVNIAQLKSPSAIVIGHYVMESNGEEFDVEIPSFSLDNPYKANSIN